jgi:hypothetical protein
MSTSSVKTLKGLISLLEGYEAFQGFLVESNSTPCLFAFKTN